MAIANWTQVNKDGFGYTQSGSTNIVTKLVTCGEHLYAHNEHGVFRMDNLFCRSWQKVFTPAEDFRSLDDYICSFSTKELWWIKQDEELTAINWKKTISKGLPGDVSPIPMTIFNGKIYGISRYYSDRTGERVFDIWRSEDIDVWHSGVEITWQQVVTQSFGDLQNNQDVDFLGVFNNKIYAGTNTLKYMFGVPQPTTGVEIWESSTGDAGTWTQINTDGFGSETLLNQDKKIHTNHAIGSWAVYKAPNQLQEYLYIGTKSHWGAEVWQYNGKGVRGGWRNVTPPWAGPSSTPITSGPGRNESMIVFQDSLYLAEGYPTANLAKYDGNNWTIVVPGPNPFVPQNRSLTSLAVFKQHLYVSTDSGSAKDDQVWGHPLNFRWRYACFVVQ